MRTALDIKRALDMDTMLNVAKEAKKQKIKMQQLQKPKQNRGRYTKWEDVFPICVCK